MAVGHVKFRIMVLCLFVLFTVGGLYWVSNQAEYTDVVVIGAGASGMSAALEAEKQGAKVILLEKMPYVGGNTLRATGGINGAETTVQTTLGIEDDIGIYVDDVMDSGHFENNKTLVRIMASKSADVIDWLIEMDADLSDVGILAGHSLPRTHRPKGGKPVGLEIVKTLESQIKNSKIELRLENKAVKIITSKHGDIEGVVVMDKSGKEYTIKAKALVLATGGFGGSPETFVYYNQKLKGYQTTNSPSATGDFIGLTEPLNVALADMDYIQTHPTVSKEYGMLITEAIRGNGGILVNNSAKRFADELENRDVLSEALLRQSNREVYLIFNEAIRKTLKASDDYIDMNIILKSDDIRELAEMIRLPSEALEQTVSRYNAFVQSGEDTDFNRTSMALSLSEGPYYAVQVIPGVHYCMGGMVIDEATRVLDQNKMPIMGLYASGEATTGVHGRNRLGGNSLLDAVVFGRIAGQNAAKLEE